MPASSHLGGLQRWTRADGEDLPRAECCVNIAYGCADIIEIAVDCEQIAGDGDLTSVVVEHRDRIKFDGPPVRPKDLDLAS